MRSASWPDELHHLSIGSTMTIRRTLTTVILFAVLTAGACSAAQLADAPPAPTTTSTAVVTLNTAALAAKAAAAVKAAKAKVVAAKAAAAKVAAAKARAAKGAITSFAAPHRCLVGGRRRRPNPALTGRGACRGRGHARPVGTQCRAW
jgi:hypothetical protein